MYVQTTHGVEPVNFNKILIKIATMAQGLDLSLDASVVAQKTIQSMADGMSTKDLDELSARIAANMVHRHPDYAVLGARILMSRLHKTLDTPNRTFADNITRLYNHTINGQKSSRIAPEVYEFIQRNAEALEEIIDYNRDFGDYDYFALTAFQKRGLETIDGQTAEVPSQMFLRVAVGLNVFPGRDSRELDELEKTMGHRPSFDRMTNMTDQERLDNIRDYYDILSKRELSLPGPIVLHAGSETNQMASCFLEYCGDSLTEEEYPITGKVGGIMKAMSQLGIQSQGGGGTAIATLSDIRAPQAVLSNLVMVKVMGFYLL
jgi:ribonucleoside-diphosphate reductase alpha chain